MHREDTIGQMCTRSCPRRPKSSINTRKCQIRACKLRADSFGEWAQTCWRPQQALAPDDQHGHEIRVNERGRTRSRISADLLAPSRPLRPTTSMETRKDSSAPMVSSASASHWSAVSSAYSALRVHNQSAGAF